MTEHTMMFICKHLHYRPGLPVVVLNTPTMPNDSVAVCEACADAPYTFEVVPMVRKVKEEAS